MIRASVLFIFAVLFFVGCGGGGDTSTTTEEPVVVQGFYADLYAEYNQQQDGDIVCDDPLFTRTEPFPPTVTTSFRGLDSFIQTRDAVVGAQPFLECDDEVQRYHTDGTFVGRITDKQTARDAHAFWNVCEVGTEPPLYQGNFGLFSHQLGTAVCWRFNAMSGVVICRVIEPFFDGQQSGVYASTSIAIHRGVGEIISQDEEVCYLRYE